MAVESTPPDNRTPTGTSDTIHCRTDSLRASRTSSVASWSCIDVHSPQSARDQYSESSKRRFSYFTKCPAFTLFTFFTSVQGCVTLPNARYASRPSESMRLSTTPDANKERTSDENNKRPLTVVHDRE